MFVCFALCLTSVAAVAVDKDFLANHPKRKTLENTNDDELSDAALLKKQNRQEIKDYYRWHQAGSVRIIPAEERFAKCVSTLWQTLTDPEARYDCLKALGHVLTDEKKDQDSTEEAAERQILFEHATTAFETLVTNMQSEEANLTAIKKNVTALEQEMQFAKRAVEIERARFGRQHEKDGQDYVSSRPDAYEEWIAKEKMNVDQRTIVYDNMKHVSAEFKEAVSDKEKTQRERDKMAKKLRHATAKFKNYRAQHEAEIAPKKKKSLKSSARRQFHAFGIAAIAMIALAY